METGLIGGVEKREIVIVDYDPAWPAKFEAERRRVLSFRDRLRGNPRDLQRYEETTRALARLDWPDMNAYAAAKTAVIESILSAAREAAP